jgi:hypothetical protein
MPSCALNELSRAASELIDWLLAMDGKRPPIRANPPALARNLSVSAKTLGFSLADGFFLAPKTLWNNDSAIPNALA